MAILVASEYSLSGIPARGDVVEGAGIFDTERAGHGDRIVKNRRGCKKMLR